MSLTVPTDLLRHAQQGAVSEEEFLACVRSSLPYAYEVVEGIAERLHAGETDTGRVYAGNSAQPPGDAEFGQLLRAFASNAIRSALERHFGVRLAFQNCHHTAAFPLDSTADEAFTAFTSSRAQLLSQRPDLVNC
jgi:hypothetical protein